MPFRNVPLSTGVDTTPSLASHRLLVANSARLPAPSSMMALSNPFSAASRMARWPLGYRHEALASVGAMLGHERAKLEKQAGIALARMDEILGSHLIDPTKLRADDYEGFFAARTDTLLGQIERAMGKPIQRAVLDAGADDDDDEDLAETNGED